MAASLRCSVFSEGTKGLEQIVAERKQQSRASVALTGQVTGDGSGERTALRDSELPQRSTQFAGVWTAHRTLVSIQVKVRHFRRLFGAAVRNALADLIQNSRWQFAPLGHILYAMTRPDIGENHPAQEEQRRWFTTTHWSVVLAAKQRDVSRGDAALEKLCRTYWPPLYAYIRRDGHDATEAQDLTQEFFARLLARDYLQHLHDRRGKFRSFLLAYLKNFLSEQRRKVGAQKRGGHCEFVSLNGPAGEDGYLLEPVDALTPDQVFERRWAQAVMQAALDRLREEFLARGQAALFERLQNYQPRDPGGQSYAQLGDDLAMTEAAVKSAVQRMRQRHRELLREEIAHTVTRPEEIEEELRHFRALLSGERG